MKQVTNTVLMVRPDYFGFNPETAKTNPFQHTHIESSQSITHTAGVEFSNMAKLLRSKGIQVFDITSNKNVVTPDAVFPNNWLSSHIVGDKNVLITYPMLTPNRRAERQVDVVIGILKRNNIEDEIIDLSYLEDENLVLEGTGSMVFDREHKIVYAALSPRTSQQALEIYSKKLGYTPISFHAKDHVGLELYHLNMMMNMGEKYVVWCPEAVPDVEQRNQLHASFVETKKYQIKLTPDQLIHMCANTIELANNTGKRFIVMSQRAQMHLTQKQHEEFSMFGELVSVDIPTIEHIGGGSARCMVAELFYK